MQFVIIIAITNLIKNLENNKSFYLKNNEKYPQKQKLLRVHTFHVRYNY